MTEAQMSRFQELLTRRAFQDALRYLADLERRDTGNPTYPYHMGFVLRLEGNLGGAAMQYERALKLDPRLAEARVGLGIIRQLQGRYDQAATELTAAIELNPSNSTAWNSLGLTYRKAGRLHDALGAYRRAQEEVTNTAFAAIRDRPGALSEERGPEGERVLRVGPRYLGLIHEALKADTTYSVVMNNIGQCYAEAGEIENARAAFREAIEFIPSGTEYRDPFENLDELEQQYEAELSRRGPPTNRTAAAGPRQVDSMKGAIGRRSAEVEMSTGALPRIIPLVRILKEPAGPYPHDANVPPSFVPPRRLLMGDLVPDSLIHDEHGWRCEYRDETPGTWTQLAGTDGGLLSVRSSFCGTGEGRASAGQWSHLGQSLAAGYPKSWDEGIDRALATSNLRYVRADEGWRMAGIPDGYGFTILQPVHPAQLSGAASTLLELEARGRLGSPLVAYAYLDESHLSYPLGTHRTISDGTKLSSRTADLTGLPPGGTVLESAVDGSKALTITRRHYLLVVGCFLRDLHRVIETLTAAGIVGKRGSAARPNLACDLPEQAGLVVRDGLEHLGATVRWFDELGGLQLLFDLKLDAELVAQSMAVDPASLPNLATLSDVANAARALSARPS